jgi:serine/threonine-protein kinase RsbT
MTTPEAESKATMPINVEYDIVLARQKAREMAKGFGFASIDLALISTAVSELARNIISYAKDGTLVLELVTKRDSRSMLVIVSDKGPGIENVELAMQDGYSTANSLGLGLPGVRRLMDEFSIKSELNKGTIIIARKWLTTYDHDFK